MFFGWVIEHAIILLPTWAWLIIAGAGAVIYYLSSFIGLFPQLKPYGILIKIIGAAALLGGVFMTGGEGVTAIWQQQLAAANERVAIAEIASKEATGKIQTRVVTQIQTIKDVQVVIQERIREVEKILDAECKIPPEAVSIHNDAARNEKGRK